MRVISRDVWLPCFHSNIYKSQDTASIRMSKIAVTSLNASCPCVRTRDWHRLDTITLDRHRFGKYRLLAVSEFA